MSPERSPWAGWTNAEVYDAFVRERSIYRALNEQLAVLAEIATARRVLDLACGAGATAEACLARLPADGALVGVDASEAMVSLARRRIHDPRARFAVAPAAAIERVVDGPFDRAVSNAAFWQFPTRRPVLAALARLLAPEALLVFNVPAERVAREERHRSTRSRSPWRGRSSAPTGRPFPRTPTTLDPERLERRLTEAGFAPAGRERFEVRCHQEELMELMEIPAMLRPITPGLSDDERHAALRAARERSDPAQPVKVPWIYFLCRRRTPLTRSQALRDLAQQLGQAARIDRLDQVLVEPGVERAATILRLTEPGQRDQAAAAVAERLAQPPGHLVAVEVRQPDVDQCHLGRAVGPRRPPGPRLRSTPRSRGSPRCRAAPPSPPGPRGCPPPAAPRRRPAAGRAPAPRRRTVLGRAPPRAPPRSALRDRQPDDHLRPGPGAVAARLDGAVVELHQPAGQVQPHPQAALGRVPSPRPLGERIEDRLEVLRLDAHPLVADADLHQSPSRRAVTSIACASGVYLIALRSRFEITCSRRIGSPRAGSGSSGRSTASRWRPFRPARSGSRGRARRRRAGRALSRRMSIRPMLSRERSSRSSTMRVRCPTWRRTSAVCWRRTRVSTSSQGEDLRCGGDGRQRVAQLVAEQRQELVLVPVGLRQPLHQVADLVLAAARPEGGLDRAQQGRQVDRALEQGDVGHRTEAVDDLPDAVVVPDQDDHRQVRPDRLAREALGEAARPRPAPEPPGRGSRCRPPRLTDSKS